MLFNDTCPQITPPEKKNLFPSSKHAPKATQDEVVLSLSPFSHLTSPSVTDSAKGGVLTTWYSSPKNGD